MLFISPPFGNYLNIPNTIPIKGSFTLEPRPGLFLQICKTLRYSFIYKGWTNKIGLRNKGIDYAIQNWKKGSIVSVAILDQKEIPKLNEKIPADMDIELNVSCPNVNHLENKGIGVFLNDKREWCIVKLSPFSEIELIDNYYSIGFRQFHCSNTIPVKEGGLSGRSLVPINIGLIKQIKQKYPETIIIAGGGIQDLKTLKKYENAGADHFSVSTLFFNPYKCYRFFSAYNNF